MLFAAICSSCASGYTQTSRQLESGELIVSGAAQIPGAIPVPKLGGVATYGIGGFADISGSIGTAIANHSIGAGVRVYPADILTLSAQGYMTFHNVGGSKESFATTIATNFRATTSTRRQKGPFYGGAQLTLVSATGQGANSATYSNSLSGDSFQLATLNAGLVLGLETEMTDTWDLQFELCFLPIGQHYGRARDLGIFPVHFDAWTPFAFQIGVALHYGVTRAETAPSSPSPRPKPSDVDERL
jgi:hypothetical protein